MEQSQYYNEYEEHLQIELLKLCTSHGMLEGTLLSSDDIDERWNDYASHYMADSVSQINTFPAAAIAWAGYIGMAIMGYLIPGNVTLLGIFFISLTSITITPVKAAVILILNIQ